MTSTGRAPAAEWRSDARHFAAAILLGLALCCFPGRPSVAADGLDKEVTFDIAPQSLSAALLEFNSTIGGNIMFDSGLTGDQRSDGIKGRSRADAALTTLLHGTGLTFFANGTTVFVISEESAASQSKILQKEATSGATLPSTAMTKHQLINDPRKKDLEEVLVTGSLIGDVESASPNMKLTHEDMLRAGSMTLDGFLLTLPQNFGGGVNDNSAAGEAAPGGSYTVGSGVNLRGLGNSATLVLMNGHRMISAGLGDYIEISSIPTAAVDRIEVVTDGASATYGSDAVAGVVNLILLDCCNITKTAVLYHYPTRGGAKEYQASQTFGRVLDAGRFLIAYEFYDRKPLPSSSRNFTATAPGPLYLVPQVSRNSLLLHGVKEVGVGTELSVDVLGSKRDYTSRSNSGGGTFPLESAGSVSELGGTLALTAHLPRHWRLNTSYTHMNSWSPSKNFVLPAHSQISDVEVRSALKSLDAHVEGPVFTTSAGDIRVAIAGQIRRDTYNYDAGGPKFAAASHVSALFGQLVMPVISSAASIRGFNELQLSVAGRYEHHSSFGSTTNPQFGVVWYPTSTLRFHGSYGKSFRTPTLDETNRAPNLAAFVSLPDLGSRTGSTATLALTGNAPNLKPERASTWTGGFSWKDPFPDSKLAITYFDVDYRDRLATPGNNLLNGLIDATSLGSLVVRGPSITLLQQLSSQTPLQSNEMNYALADIRAILDYRLQNLAQERMKGLDVALLKAWQTSVGTFSSELNSQYLLVHTRQATPSAPVSNLANVIFEPPSLRIRDVSRWQFGALTTDVALNYTNGYSDDRSGIKVSIGSFTTLDASVSYQFRAHSDLQWTQDLTVALRLINALDRSPPFVTDLTNHVNLDATNANPIGRVVAVELTKIW